MNSLREKIEREIREGGPIPFSRYMELCLYDPDLGFYSRNAEQFGKAGDFYTSSDVHAVFGRLLARQFEEMWRVLGSPARIDIVELGPGRGLFAQDVLAWSEKKFPDFFRALRYILVERSPALRARIESTLAAYLRTGIAELATNWMPDNVGVVESGTSCGESRDGRSGAGLYPSGQPRAVVPTQFVFANEFFDALPVEIVSSEGSLRIAPDGDRFMETWTPSSPEELEFLDRNSVHPEAGERVEVPLAAQCYMERIAAKLECGFIVAIDYGYTREEQLAGRHRGTLKAIRRHSVSGSPYDAPGEQDLTADVNFTALAAAAEKSAMQTHKLVTQSQFLLGIGESNQFADAFEDCRLPQERAKRALQLKHLVTPAGMGESFQVLVASKGLEAERVASLAGLNFAASKPPISGSRR